MKSGSIRVLEYKRLVVLVFLQFSIIFLNSLYSQNLNDQLSYKSLTIEDGLPNNKVNAVTMDKYGFIWFATNDGVCRFDGMEIKTYNLDPLNTRGLNINHINTIFTDRKGNLWIGGYLLFKYDYSNDRMIPYNKSGYPEPMGRIRAIADGPENKLWLGSALGFFMYDYENGSLIKFPYNVGEEIEVLAVLPDSNKLFLGTAKHGFQIFYPRTKKFIEYDFIENNRSISNQILSIEKENDSIIWIGTYSNGLYRLDIQNKNVENIIPDKSSTISNRIRKILKDDQGNLWFGTRGGLFIKFTGKDQVERIPKNSRFKFDNSIFDIYIDHHKNVWMGTYAGGVKYINLLGKPFFNYTKNDNIENSLNDDKIHGFCEDDNGNIYIGTDKGGVNFFDRKNDFFTAYVHDPNNPKSISSNNAKCIINNGPENLLIATTGGGVNKFDIKSQKFTRYSTANSNLHNDNVYFILLDNQDNLWVATKTGIDRKKKGSNIFENLLVQDDILTIVQNRKGDILAGTNREGMFIYNEKENKFDKYFENVSNSCVRTIFFDSKGKLWACGDNGLTYIDIIDTTSFLYGKEEGLPTNLVQGILEDNNRNLWLSTSAGLVRFNNAVNTPDKPDFKIYTHEDGIQNTHFLDYSFFKNRNGEMFFGGVDGFSVFHPDSIKDNTFEPEIALTKLTIFNSTVNVGEKVIDKIVLDKVINLCDKIDLSYKHKVFSIEFAALHYASPKKNTYSYMMYPFEKEWNHSDASRRFATYTNLPYGKYTFMLKTTNSDGISNKEIRRLKVNISPPFYLAKGFKISVALFILTALVLAYIFKIKQVQRQKENLEKIVAERTKEISDKNKLLKSQTNELEAQSKLLKEVNDMKDKFFSIISHDLKGPFYSVIGLIEQMYQNLDEFDRQKHREYLMMTYKSAQNTYDLLDNLLVWARIQIDHQKVQKTTFDIIDLINKNKELFSENIGQKNLDFMIKSEGKTMAYGDVNMIDTVIRNLLSNAIKFTNNGGSIQIEIKSKDGYLITAVKDTGLGMDREQISQLFRIDKLESRRGTDNERGTGLGLIIAQEFIEQNNGEIWVESKVDKGSTFYFRIPLSN